MVCVILTNDLSVIMGSPLTGISGFYLAFSPRLSMLSLCDCVCVCACNLFAVVCACARSRCACGCSKRGVEMFKSVRCAWNLLCVRICQLNAIGGGVMHMTLFIFYMFYLSLHNSQIWPGDSKHCDWLKSILWACPSADILHTALRIFTFET